MDDENTQDDEERGDSTPVDAASSEPDLADLLDLEDMSAGALLDPAASDRLEAEDRKKPIPGGEPDCPRCKTKVIRRVERYPAPRGGPSPFRVRLVCPNERCGAWTVYDW
jgi:hypothetical protein